MAFIIKKKSARVCPASHFLMKMAVSVLWEEGMEDNTHFLLARSFLGFPHRIFHPPAHVPCVFHMSSFSPTHPQDVSWVKASPLLQLCHLLIVACFWYLCFHPLTSSWLQMSARNRSMNSEVSPSDQAPSSHPIRLHNCGCHTNLPVAPRLNVTSLMNKTPRHSNSQPQEEICNFPAGLPWSQCNESIKGTLSTKSWDAVLRSPDQTLNILWLLTKTQLQGKTQVSWTTWTTVWHGWKLLRTHRQSHSSSKLFSLILRKNVE